MFAYLFNPPAPVAEQPTLGRRDVSLAIVEQDNTVSARLGNGSGLPLAVAVQPRWLWMADAALCSVFVFGFSYVGYKVVPSLLSKVPETPYSIAMRLASLSAVMSIGEAHRMRTVGMEAAEAQRRADTALVRRVCWPDL